MKINKISLIIITTTLALGSIHSAFANIGSGMSPNLDSTPSKTESLNHTHSTPNAKPMSPTGGVTGGKAELNGSHQPRPPAERQPKLAGVYVPFIYQTQLDFIDFFSLADSESKPQMPKFEPIPGSDTPHECSLPFAVCKLIEPYSPPVLLTDDNNLPILDSEGEPQYTAGSQAVWDYDSKYRGVLKPNGQPDDDLSSDFELSTAKGLADLLVNRLNSDKVEKNQRNIEFNDKEIRKNGFVAHINKHNLGLIDKAVKTNSGKIEQNEKNVAKQKVILTKQDKKNTEVENKLHTHYNDIYKNKSDISRIELRNKAMEKSISMINKSVREKFQKLDAKIEQGLAAQSALNGLFQPYNIGKFNITAALGGYDSSTAMALGSGYRFNENFAAKAAVAVNAGDPSGVSYNMGVNLEW
ncbi:YadA-like family protein [Moellerella wisconsensis]|uniref:YadA C-terminal domain-containing protein n=1 Tax=Moellerella wisconsensis TaxID=158849 RepID=UPI001F4E10B9|nr:YadA C-terminal domain-containing protein [Moellerella wisconsensis]UNH27838.1 YadA-like family protein [Moellerella wisconsensis]